jgi:hypothetical protein
LIGRALTDHLWHPGGRPCRSTITSPGTALATPTVDWLVAAGLMADADPGEPAAAEKVRKAVLDKFASVHSASRARHPHLDRRPAL